MSRIDIVHPHSLTQPQARQALEDIAGSLRERFAVDTRWQDDCLLFSGNGVDGRIRLAEVALHVQAELGFPLSMMRGAIQDKVTELLQRRFGSA